MVRLPYLAIFLLVEVKELHLELEPLAEANVTVVIEGQHLPDSFDMRARRLLAMPAQGNCRTVPFPCRGLRAHWAVVARRRNSSRNCAVPNRGQSL